jgi:DNA-binding NarL/FixJ family response regulator
MHHKPITLLLADDHPLLRRGLKETIEEQPEFSVIAEANNGESALALIRQHHPDIAVLDVDMPKMNGLDVAAAVQTHNIETKIIILTMHDTETIFHKAMDNGAKGFLLKDNAVSEINDALAAVSRDEFYITPSLSTVLVQRGKYRNVQAGEFTGRSLLTQTERRVLRMVAEHKSSKEIARQLFCSPRTVETHRNNICQKLHLQGTNALLKFALENKQHL